MALSKEPGLDSTLGDRKNALLAQRRLTAAEVRDAATCVRRHARDEADYEDLMGYVFGELRPTVPLGASNGERHPADCGCGPCRIRRGKRAAKNQNSTKGETR